MPRRRALVATSWLAALQASCPGGPSLFPGRKVSLVELVWTRAASTTFYQTPKRIGTDKPQTVGPIVYYSSIRRENGSSYRRRKTIIPRSHLTIHAIVVLRVP